MSHFSVVMSVYHGDDASFFLQAAHSILNQTLLPSEFIITVDGPIPKSMEDALGRIESYPIVKILQLSENQGPGPARHAAILKASYDVVAVMDADDISLPNRFERQFNFLLSSGLDIIGSLIEEFDHVPGDLNKIRIVPLIHTDIMRFGKWRQPMNHVTVMFRRKAYMSVGGYQAYRSVEDYDFIYRLLLSGARFANLPEVLVYVRSGTLIQNRRSGFAYLRRELSLILRMRRDHFLSNSQWILSSLIRIFIRLSPKFLIKVIYCLLRK